MPATGQLGLALRVLFEGIDRAIAWRLIAASVLALTGGVLAGLAPLALKQMIDIAGQVPGPSATLTDLSGFSGCALAYLLCLGIGRIVAEGRPLLVSTAEQGLYARLRVTYLQKLLALPLGFHLGSQTGALSQSLQQAIAGYQLILSSVVNGLVPLLIEASTVIVVLITLGQASLAISFVMTAGALWLAIGMHLPHLRARACDVSEAAASTHGQLADSLANYEPIKCFGAERKTLREFLERAMSLAAHWQQLQYRRFAMGTAVAVVFTFSVATSLAIAILGLATGTLSLGGFVLANLYMVQIVRPLEMVSSATRDVSQGLAFVRPLLDILGMPTDGGRVLSDEGIDQQQAGLPMAGRSGSSEHAEIPGVENPPGGAPPSQRPEPGTTDSSAAPGLSVSLQHVRLGFDEGPSVLQGLDLDIPAGTTVALVGASGSGKSSLSRLLLRLIDPQDGGITVDGIPIEAFAVEKLRSMIAVVPQDLAMLNATIGANIALGKEHASPTSIAQAVRLAGLEGFISSLPMGYDTPVGERGLKLSGGERQRIALARAILRNPRLYVLDEATSMLDAHTERMILENIKTFAAGRTVLMIAHRLAAARHADDIAVLSGGRIVEQGTHTALMAKSGIYAAMWRTQHSAAPHGCNIITSRSRQRTVKTSH